MKFGHFILGIDVAWMFMLAAALLWVYIVPGSTDDIRTDVFVLKSHTVMSGVTAMLLYLNRNPTYWMTPFVAFLLFCDAMSLVEIAFLSQIRNIASLWIFATVVVSVQTCSSLLTVGWYLYLAIKKRERPQKAYIRL